MREAGYDNNRIAREVGYANLGGVYKAHQRARIGHSYEATDEARILDLARIDGYLRSLSVQAIAGHIPSACLSILDRRAKLVGLDEPTRLGGLTPRWPKRKGGFSEG